MSCVPPPAPAEQIPSFTSVKGCVDVNGTTQKRWPLRDLHPKEQDAACCPFLKQSTPALPQENKDHLYPAQLPRGSAKLLLHPVLQFPLWNSQSCPGTAPLSTGPNAPSSVFAATRSSKSWRGSCTSKRPAEGRCTDCLQPQDTRCSPLYFRHLPPGPSDYLREVLC